MGAIILIPALLAGCQGQLLIHPASPTEQTGTYSGVKFYPTTLMAEVSETTAAIVAGKVVGNSVGSPTFCRPVKTRKLIVEADFTRPLIATYKPGLFEAYSFNPAMNDGMLSAIGVTSTPDQGKTIANLAGALGSVAALARTETKDTDVPADMTACTDGAIVIERIPILPKYPLLPRSTQPTEASPPVDVPEGKVPIP
jgi:hypothetical protein